MTLGSLFSGIGGFELAATLAGITPIWSNEIDPYCCKILRKNFKHKIIQKDIKQIDGKELQPVDVICGGDPCQPHSFAGMGRGKKDDRYLWPQMFRVIQAVHPTFIINENVDGSITNGVLDSKIDDLEGEGYTCQSYIIPAESVGALHKRNRVWLIGYDPNCIRSNRASIYVHGKKEKKQLSKWNNFQHIGEPVDLWPFDSYANSERLKKQYDAAQSEIFQEGFSRYFGFGTSPHGHISTDIIKSGIVRMLNGLPAGMDYPKRNKRLKSLGNAIVPQVAYEFFKWMTIINHKS